MNLEPLNFKKWIEENRHLLKPPVGNKLIWENREFMAMVVGGPNSRQDYHVNQGEEFFYQVEGDIVLKVINDGKPQDIEIKAGDVFLLPPCVPHSPQRPTGSVGLVIERKRSAEEQDGFIWVCPKCSEKLYSEFFPVTNLVTQLPPLFDRFYSDPTKCTCKKCGHKMSQPK